MAFGESLAQLNPVCQLWESSSLRSPSLSLQGMELTLCSGVGDWGAFVIMVIAVAVLWLPLFVSLLCCYFGGGGANRYLEMLWFAARTWAIQNKMDSKACRPAQTGGCWERQRLDISVRAPAPLAEFRMTGILRLETLLNGTFNLRLRWFD